MPALQRCCSWWYGGILKADETRSRELSTPVEVSLGGSATSPLSTGGRISAANTAPSVDSRRLGVGFALLALLTYGLIVLGALVRAHGAGLACPDWPLCFGQLVPAFDMKVAFEWGHRLVAGCVSLLLAGLAVATWRSPTARRAASPVLPIAVALLCVQVLLGALTVWKLLASWSVTSHLLVGNAFAACLLLTARRLFDVDNPARQRPSIGAGLRLGGTITLLLLVVQMALGGLVSSQFAGLACPDWPTCHEGQWFPTFSGVQGIHVLHRLTAYTLLVALALVAWAGRGLPRVGTLLWLALGIGLSQVAVGVANVLLRIPVEVTGLHSALAAALVLTLSLTVDELWSSPAS